MSCCCPHSRSASRVFSLFARRYRKRFQRRGFEGSQKQLVEGLRDAGFSDATLLEVGSGVGHLHQTLLEQGARSAVGVELAPRMIAEARRWAAERGLGERVHYVEGDFVELSDTLQPADVVILDKVVCCYPHAHELVQRSLSRARRVYALTYPRKRWFVRWAIAAGAVGMRLLRSDFRPYLHDPGKIETWIREAGFSKHYEARTPIWLTQVFVREMPA